MAGSAASNPWRKAKKSGELPISSAHDNLDDFKDIGSNDFTVQQTRNFNSKGASTMNNILASRGPISDDDTQPIFVTGGLEKIRPGAKKSSVVQLSPSERQIVFDNLKEFSNEINLDAGVSIASVGIPALLMNKESSTAIIQNIAPVPEKRVELLRHRPASAHFKGLSLSRQHKTNKRAR